MRASYQFDFTSSFPSKNGSESVTTILEVWYDVSFYQTPAGDIEPDYTIDTIDIIINGSVVACDLKFSELGSKLQETIKQLSKGHSLEALGIDEDDARSELSDSNDMEETYQTMMGAL